MKNYKTRLLTLLLVPLGLAIVILASVHEQGVECYEAESGQPEQRVCIFEDIILYNGKVFYVSDDANDTVPPIRIAWLKPKFEGDGYFHASVVNSSQLPFQWNTTQVQELPIVGLFHQQYYSTFYHLVNEVAPTIHFLMCKFLSDCTYSPTSRTQLIFIQDQRPNIPQYIMLDSVKEYFKCLTANAVWYKDDPSLQNKVFILRRALVGLSQEVRAFHHWEEEHRQHFREPPPAAMQPFRQRLAGCFGYNFTQAVASTAPLRILFINRHYREGRTILNQAEIVWAIKHMPELKAFPAVDIRMHYLNGDDSIRDQAALFWDTSLLIWPHGSSMAHNIFLPQGAQAIEVIPWVEEEKAKQHEWAQAIRDTFALNMTLYMVQNKERRRVMFNLDALLQYPQYKDATPEQKVAVLERGECPPGVERLICPIWWNHWQASLNLDWAAIEPALKQALGRLAEMHRAAGSPTLPGREPAAWEGGGEGSGWQAGGRAVTSR